MSKLKKSIAHGTSSKHEDVVVVEMNDLERLFEVLGQG